MAPTRSHPSVTIPRGFHFHYQDGQLPKTPEPGESHELHEAPPAPRQSSHRNTASRPSIPHFSPPPMLAALHDAPVPTIEHPSPERVPAALQQPASVFAMPPNMHFLAPQPFDASIFAPPKTPVGQIDKAEGVDYFDVKSQGESISRPSTACSNFSDSSMSSDDGSLESFPSFAGDSVSPESESADPFTSKPSASSQDSLVSSPLTAYQGPPKAYIRTNRKFVWTEEMDHHLYRTFLLYLNDPEHTPFKLFPGTHPPLGVCHRVAREARRTWRSVKSHDALPAQVRQRQLRSISPDTPRALESGGSTPVATEAPRAAVAQWPPNHATRRRLRELCKRKPSLSAHYQRLMQSRSPSPFESSSSADTHLRTSAIPSAAQRRTRSAFNTRDVVLSLVTTTSSAMQSGNPLSELATQTPQPMEDVSAVRPVSRSSAHQKSHSLQLGIEASSRQPSDFRAMLASPFQPQQAQHSSTWAPRHRPSDSQHQHPPALAAHFHTATGGAVRRLAPPAELHAPAPLSRTLKRRALAELGDVRGGEAESSSARPTLLDDIFGAPADSSHRRVRSRGFSLGDMNEGVRRVSSAFTQQQPTPSDKPESASASPAAVSSVVNTPDTQQTHGLATPFSHLAPPPRLGSPFTPMAAPQQHFSTIPKSFKQHHQHARQSPLGNSTNSQSDAPTLTAAFGPTTTSFEERLLLSSGGPLAPGRVSKTPTASGVRSLHRNFFASQRGGASASRPSLAQFLWDQHQHSDRPA